MARTPSMPDDEIIDLRLARSAPDLWPMLDTLYGHREDFADFRDALLKVLRKGWSDRPADLRRLDLKRDLEPDWFQRPDMAGYVFYIDRFNGTLQGILDKLDYLEDLGITYVHLMPCLKPRTGDTTHDLQMALNAGCASVGVSYGAHEPHGFAALQPRAVVHTVDELQRWLLTHA